MNVVTRSQWGAIPPDEPLSAWNPDDLLGIVVHHFAVPRSAKSASGSAALMRSVQRSHQAGEFSDIAYNHCFDKFGQVFEGRGFGFQTGAHTPLNDTHASICYIGDSDLDGFPEAAQDAAGWLIKQWFNRGTGVHVVPHGQISAKPTGCPGSRARTWVTTGGWKTDLPTSRFVQFFLMDDNKIVDRSLKVPASESLERWRLFSESDAQRKAHDRMAAEGTLGKIGYARKVTVA